MTQSAPLEAVHRECAGAAVPALHLLLCVWPLSLKSAPGTKAKLYHLNHRRENRAADVDSFGSGEELKAPIGVDPAIITAVA